MNDFKEKEENLEISEENLEDKKEEETSENSCEEQIKALELTLAEVKDQYLRAYAEIENLHRRTAKEKEEAIKFGASSLAKDMIVFVDNLERAVQCAPKSIEDSEVKGFIEGLHIIVKDVLLALEKHGICKIISNGQNFDPLLHQAVGEVPAEDGKAGMVSETLQTGYTINGRLLRAAMVIVTK